MLQWIANLLSQNPKEPPWVHVMVGDGLEARVCEYTKHCGHEGYALELRAFFSAKDEWVTLGFIGGEDLQRAIMLLQEGLAYVNDVAEMPRQLQTVWLWDAVYYADERCGELRKKDDPSDRVPLVRN